MRAGGAWQELWRRAREEGAPFRGAYLTRRWALRESLPPTEVTLHV